MKKLITPNIVFISVFAILLVLPILFTDFKGGEISDIENRQMAYFPDLSDYSIKTIDENRLKIEDWINDNVGFRETFVKNYTVVKNKIFKQSSSPLVMIGEEGWYFYTGDNNIEIATGKYPLTENDLKNIAKYQQAISDYYHNMGKEYVLMLTPSKVSIYSEYLPLDDEIVTYTPMDMVYDYLTANTDVVVYNSKPILLAAKKEGQLYHKTDSHWNERGSYYAYKGLFEKMEQYGYVDGYPIEVTFEEGGEHKGEFSAMLGNKDLLSAEGSPVAVWDYSFHKLSHGTELELAVSVQRERNPSLGCSVLKNDYISYGKTLQIYGDSQIEDIRKIPRYLSEHFPEVFNYGIRQISTTVDEIADPDIVIFSCSERYISQVLTVPAEIPSRLVKSPSFPPDIGVNEGINNNGMWVDICNGHYMEEQSLIPAEFFENEEYIALNGWAADFSSMQPLSALYLRVGDKTVECAYGISRESVSSYFGADSLLNTGFSVVFPSEYILCQSVSAIQFVPISSDGMYHYGLTEYTIQS